jgi:hypothetical protein
MGVTDGFTDDTRIPLTLGVTLQIPCIGRKVKNSFGCCAARACVEAKQPHSGSIDMSNTKVTPEEALAFHLEREYPKLCVWSLVLGLWVAANEGAKFWLSIMNNLRNRGVEDILIAGVIVKSGV